MQLKENVFLLIAVSSEVLATGILRKTEGFTVLAYSLPCGLLYMLCHYSFSKTVQGMNLAVAYALWCGFGIVASTLFSSFLYGEKISLQSIALITIIGICCILLDLFN